MSDSPASPTRHQRHQNPWLFIAIFVALSLGALLLALAGQPASDTGAGETPGPAMVKDCPRGTPDGFSLSDVEGQRLADVERWAEDKGMIVRVVMEDGEPRIMTMDYRTDRINTQVEAGVVTRYCGNY